MEALDRLGWAAGAALSIDGLRIGLRANSEAALARMLALVPPDWAPASQASVVRLYSLLMPDAPTRPGVRQYHLAYAGGHRLARSLQPDDVLGALAHDLESYLGGPSRVRSC